MSIIRIDSFSVSLRKGGQILAYNALSGTECLPEYVSCDVLARIVPVLLNKPMGTAGWAENVGCSEMMWRAPQLFLDVVSNLFYQPTLPSNSIEFKPQIPKWIAKDVRLFSQFNPLSD
jgi:hypothetical protein